MRVRPASAACRRASGSPSPGAGTHNQREAFVEALIDNVKVTAPGRIGWSAGAGRVLLVLAYRDLDGELRGLNAWPASGRDLATYLERSGDGEEEA